MPGIAKNILRDQKHLFDTEHLKADLKGRSVRGGAATLAGQGVMFIIQTASTMILARLLTPADYGLIAMVTAVTGFASLFKDLGLSMATVQKAEITHEQVTVLFWINVAISVVIAIITASLSPVIAWFYGEPRLTTVGMALSIAFILGGFTVQHQALLRRQMRFTILAFIPIVSTAVASLAAAISAALGLGYWALVVMELARASTNAVAVWIASPWRPGLPGRHARVRGMLNFGAHLTGFNILNYFARNLDNVLIGRIWGADALGLYAKAYGLLMLPITQITAPIAAVAVPTLSRLQDEPEEYKRYYYRAINVIAWLTMPLVCGLAALSRQAILIVLGEQWVGAAAIFECLAFAALFQPVVSPVGWVYISLGRTVRMMQWGFFAVPIIIASFVVGLPWGALGVSISYMLCSVTVLTLPCLWWAFKDSTLTIHRWIEAVYCPLIVSLISYGAIRCTVWLCHSNGQVWLVAVSGVIGVCSIALVLRLWQEARIEALNVVHLVKLLRTGRTV